MEIKIKKINIELFKDLVLKLKKFNNNLYLKINYDNNKKLLSNIYLDDYDGAKSIELELDTIFEFESDIPNNLKILFYDADIIIKALDIFKKSELTGSIKYKKYNDFHIATDVYIKDDKTKIQLYCADEKIMFKDMTEDEYLRAYDFKQSFVKFKMTPDSLKEVLTYFKLDKDNEIFNLKIKSDGIYIIGNNYEAKIANDYNYTDKSIDNINIYKDYITKYIDKEDYNVYACTNKIILESLNSKTLMTLAIAITNHFDDNSVEISDNEFSEFDLDI